MSQKIVVLGGGFAGLYAAHITGGTLISDAPVATAKRYASSYIFLHADNRVKMLLQDFDLPYVTKDMVIGYYCNGRTYDRASSQMVSTYVTKAYPGITDNLSQVISPNYFKSVLRVCDTDYLTLLKRLEEDVKEHTIFAKAEAVHLKHRSLWLDEFSPIDYDVLISTIPLASFIKLAGLRSIENSFNFQYMPLYFYKSAHDMGNFHIVLDSDVGTPSLRWTVNDGKVVEEAMSLRDGPELLTRLPYGKIAETYETKLAKAVWLPTLERMGVYMCGRFSQWQTHFDTEDAISRVTEIAVDILGGNK